ncbi:MAG TPA: ATP-binding protein [Solirubrobacterales bacterium]|nr:ATP-binding protein [Solirubrobacterales bacterium]
MSAWSKLGLRGRLAISIGTIVVLSFGAVFVVVRAQMANESNVIEREEAKKGPTSGESGSEADEGARFATIKDAQGDVEKTFFLIGGAALFAALLAGYLLAARTAAPLRRFADTAAEVDAGDLSPRLDPGLAAASELRALADAFNHMLERLDEAFARQRAFVSDASHELRSPLTAIRGQLEVLARSEAPDAAEVRRVEGLALAEMARVERLVEDLLSLARLDEGVGPSLQELPADSFLRELIGAGTEGIEVGGLAAGSLRADPDLIAQVLRNLIDNARRHAGTGGRVSVSSAAVAGALRVHVDDDGPGIPPAERERVFERFHRTEAARSRASGGSGLGLGIARSILVSHGGRIWIEDSPLGGARVSFELPGFTPEIRGFSANG